MRNPFKRLAVRIVTAYANRALRKAVEAAQTRSKVIIRRHYVLTHPWKNRLIVVTAKEFQQMKRNLNVPRNFLPQDTLQSQSWYYTDITPAEQEIRRLAFINDRLKAAKLL